MTGKYYRHFKSNNYRVHHTDVFRRFLQRKSQNHQQGVGYIAKSYIFASAFEIGDKTADVAQLARARDL